MANLSNLITPTNVLTATSTNTVTNKTISGSSNTITNVSLTSGITGTLPAANGGTGLTSPGANGNVLTSNGTAWVSSPPSGGGGGITLGKSIAMTMVFGI